MLRAGLVVIALGVPVIALAPAFVVFAVGLAAYGVALGVVDAATNMQAVALEHRYGRPILPSFHGAWTLGGVVGSALTLATSHLGLGWAAWLAVVAARRPASPPLLRRADVPVTEEVEVPWRPILLVGAGAGALLHGRHGRVDLGPDVPRQDVRDAERAGRAGDVPVPAGQPGVPVRRRHPGRAVRRRPRCCAWVPSVASAALAVVVFAPTWPVAVLGFTLLGAGAAVVAPLSFSAAARIAGGDTLDADARAARVDAVIARFNQFNYVGALLGAVLTGLVGANSLRYGFALPMVLVLGIIPLAPAFLGKRVG